MSIQILPPIERPFIPSVQTTTPKDESFGACIKQVFIVFWNAIKKCIADIQAFFQNFFKEENNNPLKTKTLKVESIASKPQTPMQLPLQAQPVEEVQSDTSISRIKQKAKVLLEGMDDWGTKAEEVPVPEAQEAQSAELTAYQREHRIRVGAADIQARIEREGQHAQNQMAREKDKAFVYKSASEEFSPFVEEASVGGYKIGLCHFQGPRSTMEDAYLAKSFHLDIGKTGYEVPLFAVMDGHGGVGCAEFVRDNLQQTLQETLTEFNPQGLTDEGIWNALKHTGVNLHERFCAEHYTNMEARDTSGTTLVFSIILKGKLWTANVGDSRAILDNNGEAVQLSEDAKPADPDNPDPEITRYNKGILHRGGAVQRYGGWRVNGALACARSIGDPELNGANSARAKITMISLDTLNPYSYLILGCDGIFDVASTKQIVNVVSQDHSLTLGTLAKNIVFSTAMSGSQDNQSLLIVQLA